MALRFMLELKSNRGFYTPIYDLLYVKNLADDLHTYL